MSARQYSNQKHHENKTWIFLIKTFALAILLLFLSVSFISLPDAQAADPKKKLSEIKKKLKKTKERVKESKAKEKSVLSRIQNLDRSIKKKGRELQSYNNRISKTQSEIQNLSKEISTLNEKMGTRQDHLKERLMALYKQQYGGHALVLISAKDNQDLIKKSKYISLIAYYDRKVIDKYGIDIHKVNAKKKELEVLNGKLKQDKASAKKTQKALKTDRIKKDKLLSMIRSKRKSYEKTVKELEESSSKLKKMLRTQKRKKLPKSITGKGFQSLKGRLGWPVTGRVLIPFGKYKSPEFNITVFKNGIEIKSKPGERPKAVSGGRVVYADWFKGYGLLLIIDHGSGYHSLYGNLSEIFLKDGDILIKGTALGKVGKSSLLDVPTLYFEIRHKGKPVDPTKWLKRKRRGKKRIN